MKAPRRRVRWLGLAAVAAAVSLGLACGSEGGDGSSSAADILAQLDGASSGPYRSPLASMSEKCDMPASRIADMAVVARDHIMASGGEISLLRIIQDLDSAIPDPSPTSCEEQFAAYAVLAG